MDDLDLSHLLDQGPDGRPALPPVEAVVHRHRRQQQRRLRLVSGVTATVVLVGAGLGVGLASTSSPGTNSAGSAGLRLGRPLVPAGLQFIGTYAGGATRSAAGPVHSSSSPSNGGSRFSGGGGGAAGSSPSHALGVCTVAGCNPGGVISSVTIPTPDLGRDTLTARVLTLSPLVWGHIRPLQPYGWKPIPADLPAVPNGVSSRSSTSTVAPGSQPPPSNGAPSSASRSAGATGSTVVPPRGIVAPVCSAGSELMLTLWGPLTSDLAGEMLVPAGPSSGHPIDTVATAILGTPASGRYEVLVVRAANEVTGIHATWFGGGSQSASFSHGWAVLAVPYRGTTAGLVNLVVTGASGNQLEQAVVPANGSLASSPVACPGNWIGASGGTGHASSGSTSSGSASSGTVSSRPATKPATKPATSGGSAGSPTAAG